MKIILGDYEQGCGKLREPLAGEHQSLWKSEEAVESSLRLPFSNLRRNSQGKGETEAHQYL